MTDVPMTPRRFRKWLGKQSVPPELVHESVVAILDVEAMALNRGKPDADVIIPRLRARVEAFVAKLA